MEIYELSCLGFDIDFAALHWAGDKHVSGFQVPELPSWSPPQKKTQHASSQVQTILLATSKQWRVPTIVDIIYTYVVKKTHDVNLFFLEDVQPRISDMVRSRPN